MDWQGLLTPVLTAAIGAILAGIMTWFVQSRIEALRRETERLRDERKNIYMEILEPMMKTLSGINNPDETESALDSLRSFEYRKVMFELNFIGSDPVVEALNDFMQSIYSGPQSTTTLVSNFGTLMLTIRKDLGYKKTKLNAVDMLKSQITDISKFMVR